MRLPPKKRPGNPILATDWNMLIDALVARTPRPGQGTELVASSGGFSFRARPMAGGGEPVTKPVPLTIIASRPPYIQEANEPPSNSQKRYYVEWGTLNNAVAENWNAAFDLSTTTYFFAKATLLAHGPLTISSWQIVTGNSPSSETMPAWEVGSPRPAHAVILLGTVFVQDEVHSIAQSGGGSIVVSEHITSIRAGSGAGEIELGKEISYHRTGL